MKQLVSILTTLSRYLNGSATTGHVLYLAIVFCSVNATSTCNAFLFRNIVDTTTLTPMGVFSGFGPPAISGGTVAFRGFYSGGHGIFIGGDGPLITVAKTGAPAPTGAFTLFTDPSFSDGVAAFRGFSQVTKAYSSVVVARLPTLNTAPTGN